MKRYVVLVEFFYEVACYIGGVLTNCFTVVLSPLHSDEGDEFQLDVHMSSSEGAVEGGSECGVCQLWM
jgi:hypothetical protein